MSMDKKNKDVDTKRYGEYNSLTNKDWNGGMRDQADRWRKDKAALERGGKTAGRIASRGMRAETSAKYRLAQAKAEKKNSSVGKMLDKKEMSNAPRKPFMTKMKKSK